MNADISFRHRPARIGSASPQSPDVVGAHRHCGFVPVAHVAQMSFSPTSRFWAAPPGGNGCLFTELSRFSDSVRDLRYPIIRLIIRLSESLTTFGLLLASFTTAH